MLVSAGAWISFGLRTAQQSHQRRCPTAREPATLNAGQTNHPAGVSIQAPRAGGRERLADVCKRLCGR